MPSDPPHDTCAQPPDAHFASSVKSRQEKQKQICFADFQHQLSLTDTLLLSSEMPESQKAVLRAHWKQLHPDFRIE